MATQSDTATATELNLTPPEPIPTVDVEKAVGLVPVDEGKKTELDSSSLATGQPPLSSRDSGSTLLPRIC